MSCELTNLQHEHSEEEMADGTHCHVIDRQDLFVAARQIRDAGYRIMSCLSASDNKKADHMEVFYAFVKPANHADDFAEVRIKVRIPKVDADGNAVETSCPSITDVFSAAGWHEREMYDMYGITFTGNPDMRRMFLPDDWKGFPMRKDYSEPEQFVAMKDGEDITLSTQEEGSW